VRTWVMGRCQLSCQANQCVRLTSASGRTTATRALSLGHNVSALVRCGAVASCHRERSMNEYADPRMWAPQRCHMGSTKPCEHHRCSK
jgi:hypothetical protein